MQTSGTTPLPAATDAAPSARVRERVLLAEDGSLNRQLVCMLLERADFQVDLAENGAEALERVEKDGPFDLVLMDVDMPVMDGFTAAAAIRALPVERGGAVPILALSAATHEGELLRARRAGMDGYLAKPYDPKSFASELRLQLGTLRSRPSAPIWNRRTFGEVAARLKPERVREALALFAAQLSRVANLLAGETATPAAVASEAHSLVSSAGVLGFDALCEASRTAQAVDARQRWQPRDVAVATALARAVRLALDAVDVELGANRPIEREIPLPQARAEP